MQDGTTKTFKGTLWDPYSVNDSIPDYRPCSITDDMNVFDIGHTFYSGKVTAELFKKLTQ